MTPYVILGISFILDGVLTNFLPYLQDDLSIFTPMFTLVSILLVSPFFRKREREYYIVIFVLGILYDLFYTNLLFFNGVLFFLLGFFLKKIEKNFPWNFLNVLIETVIVIILYESLTGLILFTFNMVPVTVPKVLYKILHSLVANIMYVGLVYGILKFLPKKFKKISIN